MIGKARFEALISRARGEQAPTVDVAETVIELLGAQECLYEPVSDRPLVWLAAFSSAVAVPVVIAAVFVYQAWSDPLLELSRAISWVIQ